MDRRRAAVIFACALAAVIGLRGAAAGKKVSRATEREPSVKGTPTLHVRAIDLDKRRVLVEVGGLSRAPLGNFFTFTDERGRHFVAANIVCQEPFPSGTRACELEVPPGYEKHRLVSLLLHLHGLHGRPVAAEEAEVISAWEAAQAQKAPLTGPSAPPTSVGAPSEAAPTTPAPSPTPSPSPSPTSP